MNPLHPFLNTGTTGELLVQLRLLQYGVQAAPPLKDTGNDLIAIRRERFSAIQIKTTILGKNNEIRFDLRPLERRYHLIACVVLIGESNILHLDKCRIYLAPANFVSGLSTVSEIRLQQGGWELNQDLIDVLFPL